MRKVGLLAYHLHKTAEKPMDRQMVEWFPVLMKQQ
jgi:hypothetical protein